MKPKTLERIARIKQEILLGTPYENMVAMLSSLFGIAPRTMDNLISVANKELAQEAKEQREQQTQANAAMYKQEAKSINLAMQDIAAYLSRIIRGEEKEQVAMSTAGGPQVVEMKVHTREVLRAINIYCRYAEALGATGEKEEERITGFYIVSNKSREQVVEEEEEEEESGRENFNAIQQAEIKTEATISTQIQTAPEEPAVTASQPEQISKPTVKPHRPQEPAHVNARNRMPEPRYYPPGYVKTDVDRWREEVLDKRGIPFY